WITLKESVRDGRDQERGAAENVQQQSRLVLLRYVRKRYTADKVVDQFRRRHFVEPRTEDLRNNAADTVRRDPPIQDPGARVGIRDGFGKQVMQLEYLDATLLHLEHEIVVILLGLVHPEDIIEQKVAAIAGREPLMRQSWPTHHNGP